jgi:hypothetical protein
METVAMVQSLHSLVLQRLVCMARVPMVLLSHPLALNQPVYTVMLQLLAVHILNGLFFKLLQLRQPHPRVGHGVLQPIQVQRQPVGHHSPLHL